MDAGWVASVLQKNAQQELRHNSNLSQHLVSNIFEGSMLYLVNFLRVFFSLLKKLFENSYLVCKVLLLVCDRF